MKLLSLTTAIAGIILILFTINNSLAQEQPTGLIKERIDTMKAMGKSLGVMVDMIKGKAPYNAQTATQSVDEIYDYSLDIGKQFPDTQESRVGKFTRVKPELWKNRSGFDQLLEKLQIEAENSAQMAARKASMNKPNLMRPQIAEIIEICTECHEKYRKPKQ